MVYVFTHEPYVLPTFLAPRMFSLEFIRYKIIVENEHFIIFKKASEIKFSWLVGPFIIKRKVSLPVIESMLLEMNLKKAFALNYDPHHVILQRR